MSALRGTFSVLSGDRRLSVYQRLKMYHFYGRVNWGHIDCPLYGGSPYTHVFQRVHNGRFHCTCRSGGEGGGGGDGISILSLSVSSSEDSRLV